MKHMSKMSYLINDVIRYTSSFMGLDARLKLFQTCKRFKKDRETIVSRLKNIHSEARKIERKNCLLRFFPEVNDCLFRIETTQERIVNNDKLELYSFFNGMKICDSDDRFDYEGERQYSEMKMLAIWHHLCVGGDSNYKLDDLRLKSIKYFGHIRLKWKYYGNETPSRIICQTNHREVALYMRDYLNHNELKYDQMCERVVNRLIRFGIFYDEEFQLKMLKAYNRPYWVRELLKNKEYLAQCRDWRSYYSLPKKYHTQDYLKQSVLIDCNQFSVLNSSTNIDYKLFEVWAQRLDINRKINIGAKDRTFLDELFSGRHDKYLDNIDVKRVDHLKSLIKI